MTASLTNAHRAAPVRSAFDERLRQLHEERWAEAVHDLLEADRA